MEVKMFCRHCGHEVLETDKYCNNCGKQLNIIGLYDIQKIDNLESVKPNKNGIAIAGFVCSFFIPLLGFVFGGIGLKKAKECNRKGMGFSIAAIVIATVMFFINLSILM